MPSPDPLTLRVPSPSTCANASLQAEIARVRELTVEERIFAALSMKSKFAWLQPAPLEMQPSEPDEQGGS